MLKGLHRTERAIIVQNGDTSRNEAGEDLNAATYLKTEGRVANFRWFVILFLGLYLNILRPVGWPIAFFNGILAFSAVYNFSTSVYIRKTQSFSVRQTMLLMFCDTFAVGAGLFFTSGASSPLLVLWYLSLFTAGLRFGYVRSLFLQAPVAAFYVYLLYRETGMEGRELAARLVLGLFSLVAVTLYGTIFSRQEKRATQLIADFHREAITDRLTGLHNYAYFVDELKRESARAKRDGSHFSLLIFDLDHFKQVNDTYGHEKGNILLRGVADILNANARAMDTVARYGGEEFVILMPNSNGSEMELAERIRKKIEGSDFCGIAEGPLKMTISAGVCTYPKDAASVFELLDKADRGLYQAKNTGRNRTCHGS